MLWISPVQYPCLSWSFLSFRNSFPSRAASTETASGASKHTTAVPCSVMQIPWGMSGYFPAGLPASSVSKRIWRYTGSNISICSSMVCRCSLCLVILAVLSPGMSSVSAPAFRNNNGTKSYRLFLQTCHSWYPSYTLEMQYFPAFSNFCSICSIPSLICSS